MVGRVRRALGYGWAPWLDERRVQAGLGLLGLWIVGTMATGLWSTATAHGPSADELDSFLSGLLMPGIVLPAVVLALLGSRLAWGLILAFEALDVLNNLDGLSSLFAHLLLAAVVVQAAAVVWRYRNQLPPVEKHASERATETETSGAAPAARQHVALWKRINLSLAVAGALIAFLAFSGTAGYAAHHGSLPLVTPAISMLVATGAWTGSVLLAVYLWKRLPFVLWGFVPAVYVVGFAFMSAACPGCTWASH